MKWATGAITFETVNMNDEKNDGRIPMERIDDACQRVLDMKYKLGMISDDYNGFDNSLEDTHSFADNHNKKVAENSISMVVNKKNILPLDKNSIKKVTFVIISADESHVESLEVMKEEFIKRGAEVFVSRNLNSYNYYKETQQAPVAALYGEIPFNGGEPFKPVTDEFIYLKQ